MLGIDWKLIEVFMLVFLRTGTAVALMPVFGYPAVPVQIKAGLAFFLALILTPLASMHPAAAPPGVIAMAGAAASEVLVGMVIGLTTALVLIGAEFAGSVIGVQMGFGMVNVIDPQFEEQISIIGQFQYLVALVIFITLDFHHHFIMALGDSFRIIPLGGAIFPGDLTMTYARLSADVLVLAMKLAAPVVAMVLLAEIALAFMARMMPQMNVFIVGFPVRIGVGLIGLSVCWPLFSYVIINFFKIVENQLMKMILMMGAR